MSSALLLSIPRSLQRGAIRSNSIAIQKFCTEASQTVPNPDEVIVDGRRYVNRRFDDESLVMLRNVSRLNERHRNRMRHVMKPDPLETHPDYYRSLFGKASLRKVVFAAYGNKSGIDPGTLWPSKEELEGIKEFEKEWEPTIQSMWKELKEEREELHGRMVERENLIDQRMAKMPQFIEEYKKRLKKKEDQEMMAQNKKKVMVEEARDFFGYHIDQSDPRFEQLKLSREEEEKKMQKKKKKEERATRMIKAKQFEEAKTKGAAAPAKEDVKEQVED